MLKTVRATVAAALIVAATTAIPKQAQARCYGCWAGAAVGGGRIGRALGGSRADGFGYGGYGDYGGP